MEAASFLAAKAMSHLILVNTFVYESFVHTMAFSTVVNT